MAVELHNHADESATSLVGGIIRDFESLVKQQFGLTRREIEDDFHKSKKAASVFVLGIGNCFLGAFALCLSVVHLLHALTSPLGTDPAWFPLWACHAVVGIVLFLSGSCLAYVGRQKFQAISPLQNQAAQGLKENVEWATAPK